MWSRLFSPENNKMGQTHALYGVDWDSKMGGNGELLPCGTNFILDGIPCLCDKSHSWIAEASLLETAPGRPDRLQRSN